MTEQEVIAAMLVRLTAGPDKLNWTQWQCERSARLTVEALAFRRFLLWINLK